MPQSFVTPEGRRLAYYRTAGQGPGVVFLGGFRSDMTGTKALALEDWAQAQGRAFLRFDYSGHGQSSGDFELRHASAFKALLAFETARLAAQRDDAE